jgi:predicted kinase
MTVIIITGPLASLKTTIAYRLAKDLDGVCLSKDDVKEAMALDITPVNGDQNQAMSRAAINVMVTLVKHNQHLSKVMIVEANLKYEEYMTFTEYLHNHAVPYKMVYLYAELKTMYKRYVDREPHRHPIHKAHDLMTYDMFKTSTNYYQRTFFDIATITFDTTVFDDCAYKRLRTMLTTHQ